MSTERENYYPSLIVCFMIKKGRSYGGHSNTGSELSESLLYIPLTIIGLDMFVETFGSNNGKSHTGTAYPLWEYYPNVDHTLCYQNQNQPHKLQRYPIRLEINQHNKTLILKYKHINK